MNGKFKIRPQKELNNSNLYNRIQNLFKEISNSEKDYMKLDYNMKNKSFEVEECRELVHKKISVCRRKSVIEIKNLSDIILKFSEYKIKAKRKKTNYFRR